MTFKESDHENTIKRLLLTTAISTAFTTTHTDLPDPGMQIEKGDGYAAALFNFRFMANTVWTTEETIKAMQAK